MASEGIITVGDQVIAYSERNVYVYWDINPDLRNERNVAIETPYYLITDFRYGTHEHIDHIYITRWGYLVRAYQPITERWVKYNYSLLRYNERKVYYYLDTRERLAFVEGLLTQTPLVLKYPKYYNWNYIPQVLTPEFYVWSFYELDVDSITVKVVSDSGTQILLNAGINKDKFKIEKVNDKIYKITCYIDHVFNTGEKVSIYVSMNDVKGNYLKPGLW